MLVSDKAGRATGDLDFLDGFLYDSTGARLSVSPISVNDN